MADGHGNRVALGRHLTKGSPARRSGGILGSSTLAHLNPAFDEVQVQPRGVGGCGCGVTGVVAKAMADVGDDQLDIRTGGVQQMEQCHAVLPPGHADDQPGTGAQSGDILRGPSNPFDEGCDPIRHDGTGGVPGC